MRLFRASSIEPNNSKLEGRKCLDCYLRASRPSAAACPSDVGYAIARSLARAHLWFFPGRRHAALVNLATILPGSSRRERMRTVLAMMASYNCMLFEFFSLPRLERDELLRSVEVDGHQHVLDALARGKGVIITSSHIGNWELGAVVLAHLGHQVHAVAGVQLGRWLAPAVRDAKSELAVHTIRPEDGYRKLWRALSRNDLLALMVDGDIFGQGVALSFFDREVRWPAGPGVLSKRTGAPVVSGYCQRLARRTIPRRARADARPGNVQIRMRH